MIDWQELQSRLNGAIAVVRGNQVLDTAARLAIGSIPVVGEHLVTLYDQHGEAGAEEEMLRVLRLLRGATSEGFEELSRALLKVEGSLAIATQSLSITRRSLDALEERTREMQGSLEDAQAVLDRIAISVEGYDPESPADQLSFHLQLQRLLEDTKVWVVQQEEIGREVLRNVEQRPGHGGLDDALMGVFEHLDEDQRRLHGALRRATDRVSHVHRRMRQMLRTNPQLVRSSRTPSLGQLDEHLAFWLAKYELLRDSQSMCIVYVGAPPTNRPFPKGLDEQVASAIEELRTSTKLDHF